MSSLHKLSAPERQARLRICQTCDQFAQCIAARTPALADTSCPRSLWPERARGVGDLVAAVAQPIAGAIDAFLGTNLKNCGGCAKRREALNNALPLPGR